LQTITPLAWRGTEPVDQRWLASGRIPAGDLTLYSGNGGTGKTETAVQLLISVAADLGHWLGCVVEGGPVFFCPAKNRSRMSEIGSNASARIVASIRMQLKTFASIAQTWKALGWRPWTGPDGS